MRNDVCCVGGVRYPLLYLEGGEGGVEVSYLGAMHGDHSMSVETAKVRSLYLHNNWL